MTQGSNNITQDATIEAECHHYWIIETAHGPTSKGICKHCGAEKQFLNYAPDLWRRDEASTILESPRLPDIGPDRKQDTS